MTETDFTTLIKAKVKPRSTVIIAVSGGADSIYLLQRCLALSKKIPFRIVVAHVNHGLRAKASDGDAVFVRRMAKKHRLAYEATTLKIKGKKNLEALGRNKRYQFFEKIRKKWKADWVLTAHHLNDNIETVFFNLIRGAHFSGLKGIETVSPERHLLRPMLALTKSEILEYLTAKKIDHREDESNNDLEFSRNWLRQKIIPLFRKINRNFEVTLRENLRNFAETADLLEHQSAVWLHQHAKNLSFPLDAFLKEHPAFRKNVLIHLYKRLYRSTKKLTQKHVQEIIKVLEQRRANRKKEFGTDYFILIDRKGGQGQRHVVIRLKKSQK